MFSTRARSRGGRSLRVLVVTPYSLESNPYLRLLVAALEETGMDVRLARGRSPFLLGRAVWRDGLPDVLHLQWHHRYFTSRRLGGAVFRASLFFLQWAVLRLLGVRAVWTVHNLLDHERRHPAWERFACRRWAKRVDAILVHCAQAVTLAADTYRVPEDRILVVPHGHFPSEEGSQPSRAAAREQLELEAGPRILLFFGRVRAYKGLEALLDAFMSLDRADVRLVLIGHPDSDELRDRLAATAAGDPRITTRFEFVADDLLDRYLAAADLVVLPYRDLLTSGAAIMAASRGRAVLAPARACLRDLPDDAAILYPPDSPDALGHALRRALDAPLDTMGAAAKRHVDRYPWSRVAAETVSVYRNVCVR